MSWEKQPPVVESSDYEWVFEWPEGSLCIGFDHLREERSGLMADLHLLKLGQEQSFLYVNRLNLVSAEERLAENRRLTKKFADTEWGAFPWAKWIETMAATVMTGFRRPAELVTPTPRRPTAERETYLYWPFILKHKTTIVHAPGGSGKSFFALALAVAVAAGKKLPHCKPGREPVTVIYYDWEEDLAEFEERYFAVLAGFGLTEPLPNLHYRRQSRPFIDDLSHVRLDIARTKAGLVVCDSLRYMLHGEAKSDKVATDVTEALRTIPAAFLLLAHQAKADTENGEKQASVFGSIFYTNHARSQFELTKGEGTSWELREDGTKTISSPLGFIHQKTNKGALLKEIGWQQSITVDDDGNALELRYDAAEFQSTGKLSRARQIELALAKRSLTTKEVAAEVGIGDDTAYTHLRRLEDRGVVERDERGTVLKWGLAHRHSVRTIRSPYAEDDD